MRSLCANVRLSANPRSTKRRSILVFLAISAFYTEDAIRCIPWGKDGGVSIQPMAASEKLDLRK
jgi:hypothetical protein